MRDRILLMADDFAVRHLLPDETLDRLHAMGDVLRLPVDASAEEFRAALRDRTALLLAGWDCAPTLDRRLLESAPDLRFIACLQGSRWRTIDAPAALERGIVCCDPSGALGYAVAEFALGLILACLRDIPGKHRLMADGGWWSGWEDAADGRLTQLRGQPVGIVGMGEIGRGLIRLLAPFECDLTVWSSYLDTAEAARLGVRIAGVTELCATSDVVVVATQPRPATAGLVNAAAIDAMRPGSLFVLVGRAATVDTDRLYRRVTDGELRLGIDVYEHEPLPAGHVLRGNENVVHTPHVGSRTIAANRAMVTEMVADLGRLRAGERPQWAATERRVAAIGRVRHG